MREDDSAPFRSGVNLVEGETPTLPPLFLAGVHAANAEIASLRLAVERLTADLEKTRFSLTLANDLWVGYEKRAITADAALLVCQQEQKRLIEERNGARMVVRQMQEGWEATSQALHQLVSEMRGSVAGCLWADRVAALLPSVGPKTTETHEQTKD